MSAPLNVTADLDYAVRALATLAACPGEPQTVTVLAEPHMSVSFLQQVLGRLRCAGLLRARRGAGGGYWLARPATTITVGDIVRALHPRPQRLDADGDVEALWRSLEHQVETHLDATTIAELACV